MSEELDNCFACGALPCDWTQRPANGTLTADALELAARAMCDAAGCVWDCGGGPAREEWLSQARAAARTWGLSVHA